MKKEFKTYREALEAIISGSVYMAIAGLIGESNKTDKIIEQGLHLITPGVDAILDLGETAEDHRLQKDAKSLAEIVNEFLILRDSGRYPLADGALSVALSSLLIDLKREYPYVANSEAEAPALEEDYALN